MIILPLLLLYCALVGYVNGAGEYYASIYTMKQDINIQTHRWIHHTMLGTTQWVGLFCIQEEQ